MRVHLPSLPHTETTPEFVWCAYTAKVLKFAGMLTDAGHHVILYAGTNNTARCAEHVEVVTVDERRRWFGGYDWDVDVFDGFQPGAPWWETMNDRTVTAIAERTEPGDLLGVIAGRCQQPIAKRVPMPTVEWGIGYAGVFADYRVFESYAWQHHLAAREASDDLRWYDTVIPNSFDPADFTPRAGTDGDYLLFLGRHTPRKGLAVVEAVAAAVDLPVLTAGQGVDRVPGCEHVGVVRGARKAELLAGARALLAPTTYLEPFGGVAVEAMLSGTPAITTDYGAFTETVRDGTSGFRCRTLAEFLDAVDQTAGLDRAGVADWAQQFTTTQIGPRYDRYLRSIADLYAGHGWDHVRAAGRG